MLGCNVEQYRVDENGNRVSDAHVSRKAVVEYIPPIKLSGFVEMNRRRLGAPAQTIVLEALRRHKTKRELLKLSDAQYRQLGLTRKQVRVAVEALRGRASDLVTIAQEGHQAATVAITSFGSRFFDPKSR